jgi:DNA replication protein DnaC
MTVKYRRLSELFSKMAIARSQSTYVRAIKFYIKTNLLILDEWLLYPLSERESRNLLETLEARNNRGSLIFARNLKFKVGILKSVNQPSLTQFTTELFIILILI